MRIIKKYKVQIEKKYEKNLSKRWKSDKAQHGTRCELCWDYIGCSDCPFCAGGLSGCMDWMKGILPKRIYEMCSEDETPKEFFKVLREYAKQYIEWI